jgi:hypothetical protein
MLKFNYRPISILNNFSKLFEFFIHEHVSHYLKLKLNPCQHGFTKHKSTTTNLITPLVRSQRQVDAIYFDLTSAFDLVPHSLLLQKLSALGFSDGYVCMYKGGAIKLALAPRPLMIYCASPLAVAMIITVLTVM